MHCFWTNTVSAVKAEDVLSLEKVFKNTQELLEKLKAAGFVLNRALQLFLEDLGSLMYYLSGKDITICLSFYSSQYFNVKWFTKYGEMATPI